MFAPEYHDDAGRLDRKTVQESNDDQVRYAEYIRRCWRAQQQQANQQASEITLRLMRQSNPG